MPVHSSQADSRFVGCQPRSFALCHFLSRRSGRCRVAADPIIVGLGYGWRRSNPWKGGDQKGLYGGARGAAARVNLIAVIVSSFSWLRYTSDFTVGRSADWLWARAPEGTLSRRRDHRDWAAWVSSSSVSIILRARAIYVYRHSYARVSLLLGRPTLVGRPNNSESEFDIRILKQKCNTAMIVLWFPKFGEVGSTHPCSESSVSCDSPPLKLHAKTC